MGCAPAAPLAKPRPMTLNTSGKQLDKTFDPAAIEAKWYAHWETNGLFRPARPDAVPFTIVNPPPNVTGSLHIGHALDNTLQDIVVRYERLRGKDALWVVGTDHAGIATQMVVERQLEAQQDKRTNYSREAFIEKVWEWKARERRDDHRPAAPAGLLDGLVERAVHHGPAFHQGRGEGVRRTLQPRPDLPRQTPGELGPQAQDRNIRP